MQEAGAHRRSRIVLTLLRVQDRRGGGGAGVLQGAGARRRMSCTPRRAVLDLVLSAQPCGADEPRRQSRRALRHRAAPPLRIVKGKDRGAALGFQVVDANGRKYLLKLDPAGHLGLTTAAEMTGPRLFHAAGYNVPPISCSTWIPKTELQVDAKATFRLYDLQKRPLRPAHAQAFLLLSALAGPRDGRVRRRRPGLPGSFSADSISSGDALRPGRSQRPHPRTATRSADPRAGCGRWDHPGGVR